MIKLSKEMMLDNAAVASQNVSLLDDPVTREAITANIITPLTEQLDRALKLHVEYKADAQRFRALRRMCGYVENGTSSHVILSQDDATRVWAATVGDSRYYAEGFEAVIDTAANIELKDDDDA